MVRILVCFFSKKNVNMVNRRRGGRALPLLETKKVDRPSLLVVPVVDYLCYMY